MVAQPILVTGGAGFVGSHCCKALAGSGFLPVVYDNLTNGRREAVKWGPLEVGDLADRGRLDAVLARYRPAAVLHFAASAEVGLSVREPRRFYANNVANSLTLLDAMRLAGVGVLVASSTAAVYGEPQRIPIPEDHPIRPINPYGSSKAMVERIVADTAAVEPLAFTLLRYFNASGADPDGELAENHEPETHLIPRALRAAFGELPALPIFGTDYDTVDGTSVRDYVHVSDLADAHVLALRRLLDGGESLIANLGTGRGNTVRDVTRTVERVTGRPVPTQESPRRPGDPAVLVAAADRAGRALGWRPRFPDIEDHVAHAAAALGLR